MMSSKGFDEWSEKLELPVSTKNMIDKYIDILYDYNKITNLVGKHTITSIVSDLILPSILSIKYIIKNVLIDVGSGAGVVGIPVKLIKKYVQITLCEKNLKKVAFLNESLIKLNIKDVDIMQDSLENIPLNRLQNVEQLLIRGIKLVNIHQILRDKFPRGTYIVYFGSESDVGKVEVTIEDKMDMPGNEKRGTPLFIFLLRLT